MSEEEPSLLDFVKNISSEDLAAEPVAPLTPPEPEPAAPTRHAVLFELEYLVANARDGIYGTIKSLFDARGVKVPKETYNRLSSVARPEHYVDELLALLDQKKLSSSKLANDINSGVAEYLATQTKALNPTLAKVIDVAREKDMVVAALTALPKAVYSTFATKLALVDRGVEIFSFTDADKFFPKADSWLKVAKEIEVQPRNAVALVTTSIACRGALTAGMRCIALPDEFTSYQDFGGAYSIVDNVDDLELDDIFSILPDAE